MLGLGLALDLGLRSSSGAAAFDPATLALSAWYKAPFTASPWTPTASAGASGTNGDLTEATNPPASGATLGGQATADFDGTNDLLTSASGTTTFLTGAAWSAVVLFRADAAAADNGATLRRLNPALIGAGNLKWGIYYASDGVSLSQTDGASTDERVVAASTGAWHLAQAKFGSGNLSLRVDSGAWSTLGGLSNGSFDTTVLRVGKNQVFSVFYDGRIAEIMLAQTALPDATFDQIKSYVNAWTGQSL